MTSVLPEAEAKVAKVKQKLMNDSPLKEETRSFLSFSRGNLSISQSDLERGFNRHRFRPDRNTIVSVAALSIALLCLGLETWKLRYSLANKHEIEELKRDVEGLKHRLLKEDLLDELKAFEEQLYAQDPNDDDEDPGEADIEYADYESSYDDDSLSFHDRYPDITPPNYGARTSDFPDSSSTFSPVPSPEDPRESSDKAMMEVLAAVQMAEAKRDQELKKKKASGSKALELKNDTKQKRDVLSSDSTRKLMLEWETALKRKRSIGGGENDPRRSMLDRHPGRDHTRRTTASDSDNLGNPERKSAKAKHDRSMEDRSRHPPKKYYTHSLPDSAEAVSSTEGHDSSREVVTHKPKKSARRLRKSYRSLTPVVAAHYGADKGKLGKADAEHAANGRVRHLESVFKAWSPSDWVEGLKMNQHLEMKENGSLVVHQNGLYLVYAQIHYMDDRKEAGFHLEVNNRPILQCTNYNPDRNVSSTQSCFSAQVTLLNKDDVLVLKEVSSSSRFVLLEADKTFLGLVRLGQNPR